MRRDDEIKKAQRYAEKVLDEQVKAEPGIKRIIRKHLSEIIRISMSYKGHPERFRFSDDEDINEKVNEAIRALNDALYQAIEKESLIVKKIAEDREDNMIDDVLIIGFLSSLIGGKTLKQRINLYTTQLKTEIEAFIAAGMAIKLSPDGILREWQANKKSPYGSTLIKEAIKKGGFAATRIQTKGIHYGIGRYIGAFENIRRLYITTIQEAYNKSLEEIFKKKGFIGWFTVRGSNYPCPICESMTFVIHSPDESFIAYHPFCMCLYIPIYN